MKFLLATLILLNVMTQPSSAQEIDLGIKAYKMGDYARAMRILLPLAKIDTDYTQLRMSENSPATNPLAQYYLGLMYCNGEGVARNRDIGIGWLNKAIRGGNSLAENTYCRD